MERVILHSDLNNFYASVECLYHPELRDKPVAVCGSQSTRHGIVLAKNQIAKKMGVKTGEAIWEARNKCPDLVIVRPNFHLYMRFSLYARRIYEEYTDLVEAFGIDENWLDVTGSTRLFGSGEKIAHEIRERIKNELGITVSVGVSYNKIFAKLASDMKKPDAVTVITEKDYRQKVWPLPVKELLYVGRSTGRKLNDLGIVTIGDLANTPVGLLARKLGKWGETLWLFANGYDDMPVSKITFESLIKGIGNSLTAPRDLTCDEDAKLLFQVLAESVGERLRRHNLKGRTVQISIRDTNLEYITRQAKLPSCSYITREIADKAFEIFKCSWDWSKNVRALGIRVTDLVTADRHVQLSFLEDEIRRINRELVDHSIDSIRERFGYYAVQRASLLNKDIFNTDVARENVIHPVSYFR